ncbi:hypothetical protein E2C01_039380 [Portunus trituberculatus]|uniref:Uncharacterized protein n=1 Tax=Portunus trituberculatus TaxID=210409 RepID=A0A5B7FJJ4_PORTR|nr:hypothetical protein [Portunus trituberculatus]
MPSPGTTARARRHPATTPHRGLPRLSTLPHTMTTWTSLDSQVANSNTGGVSTGEGCLDAKYRQSPGLWFPQPYLHLPLPASLPCRSIYYTPILQPQHPHSIFNTQTQHITSPPT